MYSKCTRYTSMYPAYMPDIRQNMCLEKEYFFSTPFLDLIDLIRVIITTNCHQRNNDNRGRGEDLQTPKNFFHHFTLSLLFGQKSGHQQVKCGLYGCGDDQAGQGCCKSRWSLISRDGLFAASSATIISKLLSKSSAINQTMAATAPWSS